MQRSIRVVLKVSRKPSEASTLQTMNPIKKKLVRLLERMLMLVLVLVLARVLALAGTGASTCTGASTGTSANASANAWATFRPRTLDRAASNVKVQQINAHMHNKEQRL